MEGICISKLIGLVLFLEGFSLFYFVFEGNFQVQAPGGGGEAYIWRGYLTVGILHLLTSLGGLNLEGLIHFRILWYLIILHCIILSNISLCLHYFLLTTPCLSIDCKQYELPWAAARCAAVHPVDQQ